MLILIVLTSTSIVGQSTVDVSTDSDMTFELKDDTLYSITGQKIFVGQQLAIGNPSGINGNFRSIISKKAAIVPSIWGQDKRYDNSIENYVDSKKNREKLLKFLNTTSQCFNVISHI